jgi:soluble lytic murein transglycosylase-like protein
MMSLRAATGIVLALGSLLWAAPANAELVRFASGQVLSVKAYRVDGDVAVVLPDEVPHPDPAAPPPPVPSPAAAIAVKTPGDAIHALVDQLAGQFHVDPKLAHAVVQVESNYQPDAVSPKGAMGLMQLMPSVAREYGVKNPYDPEQNLSAGLQVLRDLLDRYPEQTALAAYNAGEGSISRYGGIPPFAETQDYVQRVMALRKRP